MDAKERQAVIREVTEFLVHLGGATALQWTDDELGFKMLVENQEYEAGCTFASSPHLILGFRVSEFDDELCDKLYASISDQSFIFQRIDVVEGQLTVYYRHTVSTWLDIVAFDALLTRAKCEIHYLARLILTLEYGVETPLDELMMLEEVEGHA